MYGYVHKSSGVYGGQQRASGPLELEFMSRWTQGAGALGPPGKAVSSLSHRVFPPVSSVHEEVTLAILCTVPSLPRLTAFSPPDSLR